MNKADVHRAWARPDSTWRPWVKPVLFAALDDRVEARPLPPPPAWLVDTLIEPLTATPTVASYRRAGDAPADTVLVIDLPGAESTLVGIALAQHGFAPIPLFNGLYAEPAVVDTRPILRALVDGAGAVREVANGAPPAFLLDSNRFGPGRSVGGGDFDNRWFSSTTDFPSADALWGAGLRRVVLVQRNDPFPAADLAPTLLSYLRRGFALSLAHAVAGGEIAPLDSVHPPWTARVRHAVGRLSFKRQPDGWFGERIPRPHGASS